MALEFTKQNGMMHIQKSLTIRKSAEELYWIWRDLSRLPEFMEHVERVEVLSGDRSHWVVSAPAGQTVEWDAGIIDDVPNERISWHSLPDSQIANGGEVRFQPAPGNRGTEVIVRLVYDPPAGNAGVTMAKLFGEEPSQQLDEDLYRFKQLMETGRIVTTNGQPHGDT